MEIKLSEYIKENTISGEYEKNSALVVGKALGFSRNWVSQNLNDYYNTGALIKINSRPVLFWIKKSFQNNIILRFLKIFLDPLKN